VCKNATAMDTSGIAAMPSTWPWLSPRLKQLSSNAKAPVEIAADDAVVAEEK